MTEKEKGQKKFKDMLEKAMQKAQIALEPKIQKAMNLTAPNGVTYATEAEVIDAYAYDEITDDERYRLLQALESLENRQWLKEDYLIQLCRKALELIGDANYEAAQKLREREIQNEIDEIKRNGGTPILCGCCQCAIGEIDHSGQKTEYQNYIECSCGRVCKKMSAQLPPPMQKRERLTYGHSIYLSH